MFRLFSLLMLALLPLYGAKIAARYDVSFSVFGKIGEARVSFEQNASRYHIKIDAGLTGTAASLGQNRAEMHESFGTIVEGVLVPERYKIVRSSDHYHHTTWFRFDHEKQEIIREQERNFIVNETRFDVGQMRLVDKKKTKTTRGSKTMPYYAPNDILSLFFNIRTLLKEIPEGQKKTLKAAGGSSKTGEVIISNPAGKKRNELAKLMPAHDNRFVTVQINEDIFESEKGELYVSLDEDFLAHEAMLKDVVLFGDIRGYRVWQEGELELK